MNNETPAQRSKRLERAQGHLFWSKDLINGLTAGSAAVMLYVIFSPEVSRSAGVALALLYLGILLGIAVQTQLLIIAWKNRGTGQQVRAGVALALGFGITAFGSYLWLADQSRGKWPMVSGSRSWWTLVILSAALALGGLSLRRVLARSQVGLSEEMGSVSVG